MRFKNLLNPSTPVSGFDVAWKNKIHKNNPRVFGETKFNPVSYDWLHEINDNFEGQTRPYVGNEADTDHPHKYSKFEDYPHINHWDFSSKWTARAENYF